MNSLSIRIPKNNTRRNNTVVSPRSGFSTPLSAKNVIIPLKNVEAKAKNYTVSNYVNSKNSAKQYVQEYCTPGLIKRVRNSSHLNSAEKSYYQKSCDLAGIARFTHTPNKGSIAASPSWASKIKNRLAPVGGKRKTQRKARKQRKVTRKH